MVEFQAAGLAQGTLAFGTSLAKRFDADYRLYVSASDPAAVSPTASDGGDRAVQVTAWVYHPARQMQIDEHSAVGSADSLPAVTAEIAMQLLDIEGDPREYPSLLTRSPDHRAHQEFQAAREALYSWRLAEADSLLRAAIVRDSAFALAHHLLAETMYWQMTRDEERMRELGPKIESHSRKADRFGVRGRLRPGERQAVNAFRAFWSGDYELARSRYDSLLAFEPYDFESLMLRGAVEVEDPLTTLTETGDTMPRQDLNVARAIFDTATALNPRWELSWGHLHRIDMMIAQTASMGWCPGFEPPTQQPVTPYAIRDANRQLFYCPVVRDDGIEWVNADRADPPGDPAAVRAAEALHQRTTDLLNKWTLIEQDQPRHHEELATFLLWEQYTPGCGALPARTDSLRAEARKHTERALAIRRDTTPQDRLILAAHLLASGELTEALAHSDRALAEMSDWETPHGAPPAPFAANVYLAAGRAHPSVDILERVWRENTMAILDPVDDTRSIDTQGMYATLLALRALGALGVEGTEVDLRFDRLQRAWKNSPLSPRDQAALRAATLDILEPALVHSPDQWADWFADWDLYGFDYPAVWKGLFAAASVPPDLPEARRQLDLVLQDLIAESAGSRTRPMDLYLPLVLARKLDARFVESKLLERLDECPSRLDAYDASWGMKSYLEASG
jgi:tetratricopeptide (TPR) repeat protein